MVRKRPTGSPPKISWSMARPMRYGPPACAPAPSTMSTKASTNWRLYGFSSPSKRRAVVPVFPGRSRDPPAMDSMPLTPRYYRPWPDLASKFAGEPAKVPLPRSEEGVGEFEDRVDAAIDATIEWISEGASGVEGVHDVTFCCPESWAATSGAAHRPTRLTHELSGGVRA